MARFRFRSDHGHDDGGVVTAAEGAVRGNMGVDECPLAKKIASDCYTDHSEEHGFSNALEQTGKCVDRAKNIDSTNVIKIVRYP